MNAEYLRDMFTALEAEGLKIDLMEIRFRVKDTDVELVCRDTITVRVEPDETGAFVFEVA